jgi:serine/threonine protein kinase/tetratricopeptide (TPR) repeat protein
MPDESKPTDLNQLMEAKRIFLAALPLGVAQRENLVERECGGNAELRTLVFTLLKGDAAPLPIEDLADDIRAARELVDAAPTQAIGGEDVPRGRSDVDGDHIGPYRLMERLGEGGFGVVYMARQESPLKRRVALKIIKLGMDTKQVVARFEAERQALALMDHPGIAKVFDAGTTETGRPYFVMELVRGLPITEYCDEHKLTIWERLELGAQVLEALQHAHQKGVIHRDIKPSNILVSTNFVEGVGGGGKPVPKIIDFGIAKATSARLTEKTIFTEFRQMIGTPEYMSPEQAGESNEDVDTRTDVYAAGVLLYELLTGTTPFDSKRLRSAAFGEMQRIIREEDPPKPSTKLTTQIATLETVATKRATQPARLSSLIRGELDWIVMKSLEKDRTRRYESAGAMAADIHRYLAGHAVLAAPPSVSYRARKFVRRNKGPVLAGSMLAAALMFGLVAFAWEAKVARGQRDRAVNAERTAESRAAELKQVSEFQASMLEQIDPTQSGRMLSDDVTTKFAEALERSNIPENERLVQQEQFRAMWGRVNATDVALNLIDKAILKPAVGTIDERFKVQPVVDAELRQTLADRYRDLGMYDAALPLQLSALETRRRELGSDHPETLETTSSMGLLLRDLRRLTDAEPYAREALASRRRVLGENHLDTLASINNVGALLTTAGRLSEAEPFYREALDKRRRLLGDDHPDTIISIGNLGTLLYSQRKYDQAESLYREALQRSTKNQGEDHPSTLTLMNSVGNLLQNLGRLSEAETFQRAALERRRRALGELHPHTLHSIQCMGALLLDMGRLDEAESLFLESEVKTRRVLGEENPNTLMSHIYLGSLRVAQGKHAQAIELLEPTEDKARKAFTGANIVRLATLLKDLGAARAALARESHQFASAEKNLIEAHALLVDSRGPKHKDTRACIASLSDLYAALERVEPNKGHASKAEEWRAILNAGK